MRNLQIMAYAMTQFQRNLLPPTSELMIKDKIWGSSGACPSNPVYTLKTEAAYTSETLVSIELQNIT
jgi:hypothetical protein